MRTSHDSRERSRCALSTTITTASTDALSADPRHGRAEAQIDGPEAASASTTDLSRGRVECIAAAKSRRRTIGSSSCSSSDIHAKGRQSRAAHCASRVVLPCPRGRRRDHGQGAVRLRRLTRPGLDTVPGRGAGMRSFGSKTSNGSGRRPRSGARRGLRPTPERPSSRALNSGDSSGGVEAGRCGDGVAASRDAQLEMIEIACVLTVLRTAPAAPLLAETNGALRAAEDRRSSAGVSPAARSPR